MAKKQTRRSISVSRTTYERLKAFCETNNISMSQLVETRVNDFLGADEVAPSALPQVPAATFRPVAAMAPRPIAPAMTAAPVARPVEPRPAPVAPTPAPAPAVPAAATSQTTASPGGSAHAAPAGAQPAPMTSAAARFAVEPPLPIIKPRQDTAAPKPAEKRPEQIFTF
jgi:hypothetical protein